MAVKVAHSAIIGDMEAAGIPEFSITSFERLHGLGVTVHDLRGTLWPYLRPDRYRHSAPICQAVKLQGGEARCVTLEVTRLRAELPVLSDGRYHVCHAGLVEWVVPVSDSAGPAWVLFAGIRRPGRSLSLAYIDPPSLHRATGDALAVVEQEEADDILEHLRQLAARLQRWAIGLEGLLDGRPQNEQVSRRALILRFIYDRHRDQPTLAELAKRLSVSESRASHIVREICGRSFQDLITDARLTTAMSLLRMTELPVLQVAARSGFPEVAHFHRLFKTRLGTTPRRYRAARQT